ncbi:MAG: class I SAM-dependent methyltransferase [Ignavibacteriaceae bacterium]
MKEFNYIEHYNLDAEKFDYFEERFAATAHDERRVHEYVIANIPENVTSILDVGCGSAWVAQHFVKKNKIVFSLDISINNPYKAITKYNSKNHFGITADSYFLPFQTKSFDVIIASEIIEHVVSPAKFVNELLRVLKKDGYLIITTPYKELIKKTLCIHCNNETPLHAHLHSFDENKLLSLFDRKVISDIIWKTFGNKILIFLRTYVLLKFLNFTLWKFCDKFVDRIYSSPAHIIVICQK